ncbi:hypothetical protein SMC83_004254 [Cronobacter sakazakii]|nr:hypothetical protein [Cronobacter sakazakii]
MMTIDTAELKAAAPYQSRFSRLWERYDEASHCNAEHMRDILEVALDALETAERHMLKADRETLELIAALEAAQKRIVELEARTVKLPSINPQMFNDDVMFGYRKAQREAVEFCAAAGINLETGGEA